jgi:hypothetical protein
LRVRRIFDENGSLVLDHVLAHDQLGNLQRPSQEGAPDMEADLVDGPIDLADVDPDAFLIPESPPQILAEDPDPGRGGPFPVVKFDANKDHDAWSYGYEVAQESATS